MGVHDQFTINEQGERFMNPRVCHDASFPTPSGYLVNLDHDSELLSPCIYGQCLRRVLHDIYMKRYTHPSVVMYITKYDFDAAYRRFHVCPAHAVKTMIIIGQMAYLLNRLPFGVESGPSKYSAISEGIFDLANDLLDDTTWNPEEIHSPLKSDLANKEIPTENEKFIQAKELSVNVPFRKASCDGYIDDAIVVALNIGDTVKRGQYSVPLAAYNILRPLSQNEPIARNDTVSKRKLEGEGMPSETEVVLGWSIDTRHFRIYLPPDKAVHWISDLKTMLAENYTELKSKEIENTIGRLKIIFYYGLRCLPVHPKWE